jgi:tyrosyl-tRNA synthetase
VADAKLEIALNSDHVYQVGKRKFARIKLIA